MTDFTTSLCTRFFPSRNIPLSLFVLHFTSFLIFTYSPIWYIPTLEIHFFWFIPMQSIASSYLPSLHSTNIQRVWLYQTCRYLLYFDSTIFPCWPPFYCFTHFSFSHKSHVYSYRMFHAHFVFCKFSCSKHTERELNKLSNTIPSSWNEPTLETLYLCIDVREVAWQRFTVHVVPEWERYDFTFEDLIFTGLTFPQRSTYLPTKVYV